METKHKAIACCIITLTFIYALPSYAQYRSDILYLKNNTVCNDSGELITFDDLRLLSNEGFDFEQYSKAKKEIKVGNVTESIGCALAVVAVICGGVYERAHPVEEGSINKVELGVGIPAIIIAVTGGGIHQRGVKRLRKVVSNYNARIIANQEQLGVSAIMEF